MGPIILEDAFYRDLEIMDIVARQCGKRIEFIDVVSDRSSIIVYFLDLEN